MSYRLDDQQLDALNTMLGKKGGQVITSADGTVTGNFDYIDCLTADVDIDTVVLKGNFGGNSATRLLAISPLPQRPIAIGFTSISLSAGAAIIYGSVD